MKTTLCKILAVLALLTLAHNTQARFVTLVISGFGSTLTNSISIGTNEVAVLRGGLDSLFVSDYYVQVIVSGKKFILGSDLLNFQTTKPVTVAGPATLTLTTLNPLAGRSSTSSAFVTFEIVPESFPPDKTVVVPAGTGGANIALESSADLIHWTNAAPGAYTNLQTHLFFRIRADRLP